MRAFVAALLLCLPATGLAQHNHAQGHDEYKDWASQAAASCCSDRDCAGVDDKDIRQTSAGTEVRIDGQWCPVLREHFLIRGRSPDWSVAHACIRPGPTYADTSPCDRLLCFTGKGGF